MQYLDVVNNKICPYCGAKIILAAEESYSLGPYDHCYCENDCLKVMYDQNTLKWVLIRVYLSNDINIVIDNRCNPLCFITDTGYRIITSIPEFNVFLYNKIELTSKIKKYLLFS